MSEIPGPIEVVLEFRKMTANKVQYREVTKGDENPRVGAIYLTKEAVARYLHGADIIYVTIHGLTTGNVKLPTDDNS